MHKLLIALIGTLIFYGNIVFAANTPSADCNCQTMLTSEQNQNIKLVQSLLKNRDEKQLSNLKNHKNFFDKLFTKDFQFETNGVVYDYKNFKSTVQKNTNAEDSINYKIHDMFAVNDKVFARLHVTEKYKSGAKVEFDGMDLYQLKEGKFEHIWQNYYFPVHSHSTNQAQPFIYLFQAINLLMV